MLDKTGTLTFGRPEVQKVVAVRGASPDEVLRPPRPRSSDRSIRSARRSSATPARSGIVATEPEHFDYTPGRGIAAIVGARRSWSATCA